VDPKPTTPQHNNETKAIAARAPTTSELSHPICENLLLSYSAVEPRPSTRYLYQLTCLGGVNLCDDVCVAGVVESRNADAISSPRHDVADQSRRRRGVYDVVRRRTTAVLVVAVADTDDLRRDAVSEQSRTATDRRRRPLHQNCPRFSAQRQS